MSFFTSHTFIFCLWQLYAIIVHAGESATFLSHSFWHKLHEKKIQLKWNKHASSEPTKERFEWQLKGLWLAYGLQSIIVSRNAIYLSMQACRSSDKKVLKKIIPWLTCAFLVNVVCMYTWVHFRFEDWVQIFIHDEQLFFRVDDASASHDDTRNPLHFRQILLCV